MHSSEHADRIRFICYHKYVQYSRNSRQRLSKIEDIWIQMTRLKTVLLNLSGKYNFIRMIWLISVCLFVYFFTIYNFCARGIIKLFAYFLGWWIRLFTQSVLINYYQMYDNNNKINSGKNNNISRDVGDTRICLKLMIGFLKITIFKKHFSLSM